MITFTPRQADCAGMRCNPTVKAGHGLQRPDSYGGNVRQVARAACPVGEKMKLFVLVFLLSILTVTEVSVQAASKHLPRDTAIDGQAASAPNHPAKPHKKPASQPGRSTVAQH